MFKSVLFRKLFISIFVVMIMSSVTLYYLSVPMIKKTIYATEEESAKTILDNVYGVKAREIKGSSTHNYKIIIEGYYD